MAQKNKVALDWAKHEGEIRDLFVSQGKTLNEVIAHMSEKHNFKASSKQYKSRFSKLKNLTAKEWIWIGQEKQHRAALGKKSTVYLYNRPLSDQRVVREVTRHENKAPYVTIQNRLANPSPERISVRTPPPIAATPSGMNINPTGNLTGSPIGFHVPQAYYEASSTQDPPTEMCTEESLFVHAAMEIESGVDASFFHMDLASQWNFGDGSNFDFSLPLVNNLHPTKITRQTFSLSAGNSPIPSPSCPIFNLELIDIRPNFQLMTNLPYLRLRSILEHPGYNSLQLHPVQDKMLFSPTNTSVILPTETRRDVLSNLLGVKSKLQLTENVTQVTSKLERLVPERYEGELSSKVSQVLASRSTGVSDLFFLFGLAAYFASNNTVGLAPRMDTFLIWIIDQKYTNYLERFLQIDTPTIHAFTSHILGSAVRIKNIKFLTALFNHGVKFDNVLEGVFYIGDMEFMKLVVSGVDPNSLKGNIGINLFHDFVRGNHFDLARTLISKGVSVDCRSSNTSYLTALYWASMNKNVPGIRFLLSLGADVNSVLQVAMEANTVFGVPTFPKDVEIITLLVEHGTNISCTVAEKLLEWSSLNCREIYSLLKERFAAKTVGVTIGDLADAADKGTAALEAYLSRYKGQVSKHQLEEALGGSIRLGHMAASVALLQYGVSADCNTLELRPLWTALNFHTHPHRYCELLIKFKANVNIPGILKEAVHRSDVDAGLLQLLVKSGLNLEEQGMEALVESVYCTNAMSTAFLLDIGVDIDTPGLKMNPLQMAVDQGSLDMVQFLLTRGANINAPAYPNGGCTALQKALYSEYAILIGNFLLGKGADILAPPALVGGKTALEAISHGSAFDYYDYEEFVAICNRLLDADAPINRPNGQPSSALHGVIKQGWWEVFARMLEPERSAIITYMWFDEDLDEEAWQSRTPTQLAAGYEVNYVELLIDRGADVNEAPGYRFGRTALQAATSSENPDMEVVQFLLTKGADINAQPAVHGGVTALQGAAISGDIMLAKLLLNKGAEVNAAPAVVEGRYAIEGAAEHGRLDMVQLLLNAGAKGNVLHGTGFEFAIELAEKNRHVAIANLLRNR